MFNIAIKNARVYMSPVFKNTNVYVKDGVFARISDDEFPASQTIDAAGKLMLPGIIDPHVHFALNVGRWTSADDFESGSRAGLYGGVTTFIDFLDPVSHADQIDEALERRQALAQKSMSNYSFHVTAANPEGQTRAIVEKALEIGLPSVKIFTAYSDSNRRTYNEQIKELMQLSGETGYTLLIHAEDEDHIKLSPELTPADLSLSRPVESELSKMRQLFDLAGLYGGKTYIVHTTCGESLEILAARPDLLNRHIFLESCPQYFYHDDSRFAQSDAYAYVLAPPLRPVDQQKSLIDNIDVIHSIGTDHCPFMSAEKKAGVTLNNTPFGIGGIEYSFPLMYSRFGQRIIDKMTINPAKTFDLYPRKGVIREGSDADFFIYDDRVKQKISESHSACDYNLYDGFEVQGRVETVAVNGKIRLHDGALTEAAGRYITREL